MKKQLLASLVAGSILATGAFAYGMGGHGNGGDCYMQNTNQNGKMMNSNMGKHHLNSDHRGGKQHKRGGKFGKMNHQNGFGAMRIFRQLSLTNEQRDTIRDIVINQKKDMVKLSTAFSENGFDSAKYQSLLKQRRDNRIKHRAMLMEKVYGVLTDKQKAQFKTLLELHEDRQAQRGQYFKRGNK